VKEGKLTIALGWINAWMSRIIATTVLVFAINMNFYVLFKQWERNARYNIQHVFRDELCTKVGDCLYSKSCETLVQCAWSRMDLLITSETNKIVDKFVDGTPMQYVKNASPVWKYEYNLS
jgi:hypothetical protein